MNYGLENYEYRSVWENVDVGDIKVENGIDNNAPFSKETDIALTVMGEDKEWRMLLGKNEQVEMVWEKEEALQAPVVKGQKAGVIEYYLNGEKLRSYDITTASGVKEKNFDWYIKLIFDMYFLKRA